MKNMKIITRLFIGYGMVLGLLLCIVLGGGWSILQMTRGINEIKTGYGTVEHSQRLRANLNQLRRYEKDIFLNIANPEAVAKYRTQFDASVTSYNQRLEELSRLATMPEEQKLIGDIKQNGAAYLKGFGEVYERIRSGEINTSDLANQQMGSFKDATHAVEKLVVELADLNKKEVEATLQRGEQARRFVLTLLGGFLVIAFGAALFICIATARSIIKPVNLLAQQADRLASGDLTVQVVVNSQDEVGLLASAFQRMAANLRQTISGIQIAADQVASASLQLQNTSEQIATGAEEVAAQAVSVATASEEMAATSNDIARNCTMAADASQQSAEAANIGAAVVQETIFGMDTIADRVRDTAQTVEALGARSEQIGNIVGTIEDIADQTNLLALNAAIEAARAGEQGRGFAVVADEVRALAERTTRATREISVMIKAIQDETKAAVNAMEEGVHEVERGAASSQKSGQALEEILQRIHEVSMQVSQIATAAEEQTATTNEVTSNMHQITDVVNQTARGAEEAAAASAQLSGQARAMKDSVSQFKL